MDNDFDFYVILDGEIAIKDSHNKDRVLTIHRINEFTGVNSVEIERGIAGLTMNIGSIPRGALIRQL